MDNLTSLVHLDISATTVVLGGLALYLIFLVLTHLDHAVGSSRSRDDLETLPGLPLLGNLLEVQRNRNALIELWMLSKQKQKTKKRLSWTVPGIRLVEASNPADLEYIQRTNFGNFVKGSLFNENTKQILGNGIFNSDGEMWHSQRKATSKIFNANNFRGIITESLDSNLEKLLAIIRRRADAGEEFDLDTLFFRFTLNSFAEMAFGTDVGALSLDSDEPVPFAAAFDFAQSVLDRRFNNPFWKIVERFNGQHQKMKEATKIIDEFAYSIIDQRQAEGRGNFTAETKKEAKNLDLLSLYMALRDENGQPMSRRALRDAVLNLIIAGRDTTAQALSWTFFHLLKHPELIEPMRSEVEELGVIDYDSYKILHQTNAVFSEGLRLHPSVPKNGWTALKDDVLPNGGPIIKAGDIVFWSTWIMGRDEELWGPDAKEFKPSRWLDEQGEMKKESQWKAHMFNGGYRLCLGMDLAKYEAASVLAAISREFDLSFAPGWLETVPMMATEQTPRYQPSLTLPMLTPLRVKATRRKTA